MRLADASTDSLFADWLLNFSTLLTASPTTYGLTSGDATTVATLQSAYATALATATTPSTRTADTIAAKDSAKSAALAGVRPLNQRISQNASVADSDKVAIGGTVKVSPPTPIPPPLTFPVLGIDSQTAGVVNMSYKDSATPTSKAKPFGAFGMQLARNIGTTFATDPAQCAIIGVITKSPLVDTYDVTDSGKKITYFARWQTRGGPGGQAQFGPWSAPVQTVAV